GPGDHDVQVPVIVVVTPRDGPCPDAGESRADIGKGGVYSAAIPVQLRELCSPGQTGDQDIQIAVVVVITPGRRRPVDAREGCAAGREGDSSRRGRRTCG